jgi:hypothetical protein
MKQTVSRGRPSLSPTANLAAWAPSFYQHVTPTMQADAAETVARLIFGTDA